MIIIMEEQEDNYMIKMFINDEEVVSNKELTIKEEMLATPSTILNNCYPKSWENIKDYVSKFYYPKDYSRCIIAKGFERGEDRWLTYNESGSNINFDTNISLPFKNITIDGKSTQATSTNPVSPSPDYPSEIECVKGKNLFDINTASLNSALKWADGSYYTENLSVASDFIKIEKGKSYISKYKMQIILFNENKEYIGYYNNATNVYKYFTISTDSECNYVKVSFRSSSNNNIDFTTIGDIQLESGSTATDYLPYNTIQVKDVGKNLFDISKVITNWNTSINSGLRNNNDGTLTISSPPTSTTSIALSPNTLKDYCPNLQVGDVVYLNATTTGTNKYIYLDVSVSLWSFGTKRTITQNDLDSKVYWYASGVNTTATISDIMISTDGGEYEPYQENILNINLQGNELCSLPNNVKDELVIENGRAKIIKRIGKVVLDGSENWAEYPSQTSDGYRVYETTKPAGPTNQFWVNNGAFLNYFRATNGFGKKNTATGTIFGIYVNIDNTIVNTIDEFKTWLTTHNVIVYYELATPTEIDLGEVTPLSTFEGVNNVSLDTNIQTNMSLTYLYKNYELIFCGIVKNSGNISLNPRYPHFCDLQILDFKNFLSESDMLDFVISNKTVVEAINMVIEAIKDYGFILGNVNIFGADDIIKAYSTQNKTAYDVFQYLADITGSRWYTRTIDEETVAIDFYDPTLMPSGMNIEYNVDWFEENQIVDLQFNYGSRDYRNKQVMMSKEVFGNINYNETLISNGYETSYLLLNNIGEIVSITINGVEKTFVTNELHDIGFEADFYYTPNKNQLESEDTYSIGTQIVVKYIPIIEGRRVVYNYDEIMRINNQTGRKGIIARYETRNDTTSSKELEKIGETYIKYKGTSEINLLLTSEKDLYNIGQIVYFDSPINELTQSYMVKTKEIKIIAVADFQKVLYDYELTSSFNSEKEINYFDNQRSKNKGNIEEGETITRNIDIENSTEILFNNLSISEVTPTGDNILDCILESPFIN